MQELEQVEWTVTDLLSENCQASLPAVSAHWSLDEAQESAHAMQLISIAFNNQTADATLDPFCCAGNCRATLMSSTYTKSGACKILYTAAT